MSDGSHHALGLSARVSRSTTAWAVVSSVVAPQQYPPGRGFAVAGVDQPAGLPDSTICLAASRPRPVAPPAHNLHPARGTQTGVRVVWLDGKRAPAASASAKGAVTAVFTLGAAA